jgi:hypothetical protein
MEISAPAWDTKYNKLIYPITPKYNKYASQFKFLNHKLQYKPEDKNDKIEEKERYKCLECKGFLVCHRGNIKRWHFQHLNSECKFDKTFIINNESDTHILAKYKLFELIKQKYPIIIKGAKCVKQNCTFEFPSHELKYEENDEVKIEYEIDKIGKTRADIVVINNNQIKYIFEICHTNKTKTIRTGKWFEIEACEILKYDDEYIRNKNIVILTDIKNYDCELCIENSQIFSNEKPIICELLCNRNKENSVISSNIENDSSNINIENNSLNICIENKECNDYEIQKFLGTSYKDYSTGLHSITLCKNYEECKNITIHCEYCSACIGNMAYSCKVQTKK